MDDENSLIAQRREKLEALQARGANPFGRAYETSGTISEVCAKFSDGATLRAAGRITAHRDMGKSHFVDLRDSTGRIQVYIHAKEVGAETIELFKLIDLGDFIGVEGTCFLTKTGEPTLKVHKLEILGKSLRPCPRNGTGSRTSRRGIVSAISIFSRTSSRAPFSKNGSRLCARSAISWRREAFSKWRRQCCKRWRAAPRRNRFGPITKRSVWSFISASRRNFISSGCWSAASTKCSS